MQLPETDNIHHQYAFKKGYRMALDGKRQASMPSDIRYDVQMREFFQLGWEQANEELTLARELANQPNWRHRAIWFVIMVFGGLATAAHLIHRIESERNPPADLNPGITTVAADNPTSISLLSEQQRRDLTQQYNLASTELLELQPVMASSIEVSHLTLSQEIVQQQPVNPVQSPIPKYIRELYCHTQIKQAKGQTIFHRWRTDKEIIATIELTVNNETDAVWSSQKMASGWQGQWYVEVLDSNKNVIARTDFIYGLTTENQP